MDQIDILQRELDKVLEQVGRVLAASNDKATTAAATKLKHVLPGAQVNFHEALDNLSEEIEHARLVMRRDLAVGALPKPEPETATTTSPAPAPIPEPAVEAATAAKVDSPAPSPTPAAAPNNETAPPPEDKPDEKPDDKPDTTVPGTADSVADQQPPNDTTDNDNISALLPGLQDYANGPPDDSGDSTGDLDFDIFGSVGDGPGAEQNGGGGDGDATMDDFLDFDFDADFGAPSSGGGGVDVGGDGNLFTNANANGNGNIDDEMDFFKFD